MSPDTFPSGIPKPVVADVSTETRGLVVTGMSGAGKTRAAAALQDAGWYVVDNLPPHMLRELLTTVHRGGVSKVAAVIDVRGGTYFADLTEAIDDLSSSGNTVEVMFLDAGDDALVRRYEEARRPHPLQTTTILDAVRQERDALEDMRLRADMVVDTTDLNVHELRDRVLDAIDHRDAPMKVTVLSFGFKNGVPTDADFIADVRFLSNPHWHEKLRPLTGLEDPVREFVLESAGAEEFLAAYTAMLDTVLPYYRPRDRHSLTIGVGCTGGKHRSVAVTEELARRLRDRGIDAVTMHRDRPATDA